MKSSVASPHPRESGRWYQVDPHRLQAGDIIATASPGETFSTLIRAVTAAPVSHVILAASEVKAIESADFGVREIRLDRYVARSPKNVRVLRLKPEFRSRVDLAKVIAFAQAAVTSQYAMKGALLSVLMLRLKCEHGRFFCSHLIAEAFRQGGIEIVPGLRAENTTPGDLIGSPILEEHQEVVREVDRDSVGMPAYFDESNTATAPDTYQDFAQRVYEGALPTFRKHGKDPINYQQMLVSFAELCRDNSDAGRDLDEVLTPLLHESGILKVAPEAYPGHNPAFSIWLEVQRSISAGMPLADALYLREKYSAELLRIESNLAERNSDRVAFRTAYLATGYESIRLLLGIADDFGYIAARLKMSVKTSVDILDLFVARRHETVPAPSVGPPI